MTTHHTHTQTHTAEVNASTAAAAATATFSNYGHTTLPLSRKAHLRQLKSTVVYQPSPNTSSICIGLIT